jgi:hypothetical protein
MGKGYCRGWLILLIALPALAPEGSWGGVYRMQSMKDWESWSYPREAVVFGEDGGIGLKRYRSSINAVAEAAQFQHESKDADGLVPGGIRHVGSNRATAERAIDGDVQTWWRPSATDGLDDWWVEVDLGRAVLATKVRIVFPDTAGVRPFRSFSVYTSEGARTSLQDDIFPFTRVGGTIEPNAKRAIEYELSTVDPGAATGDYLVARDTLSFAVVQYVRFVAEDKQPDAALAEIEVLSAGDNIALGTVPRGGGIRAGTNPENIAGLADGDMNRWWSVTAEGKAIEDWVLSGAWYEWDLGATFWLDRLVSIEFPQYFGMSGSGNSLQYEFVFYTSDGSMLSGITGERVESNYHYELLSHVVNVKNPRRLLFDLQFPRRKVRYLFYHAVPPYGLFYKLFEHLLYGEGYPAVVEMTSDYLDLGGAKSITRVEWEAETPPGSRVEVRSRTGDGFELEMHYYNKAGKEIPFALWTKLPKSQKLEPVELRKPGADWSGWSRAYVRSGEAFLSPSPRKYVQLQVLLLSDDPGAGARLRTIALSYDEPLLRGGATGRILPREAPLDSLQSFSYLIRPDASGGPGFDQILIRVPYPVEAVGLSIGEEEVEPVAVGIAGDTLKVELPRLVRQDSVEIRFQVRLVETTTEFDAWVRYGRTGVTQGVKPVDLKATTVYVPLVAGGRGLIRNLEIAPPLVTPNGDGVNEVTAIRFVVVKVEREPEVEIYNLAGEFVRSIEPLGKAYQWDGRDRSRNLVPPGIYLCRIRVPADAGDEVAYRIINVAY